MSTINTTNLKNPSSGSNNIVLNADGTSTLTPSNIIKSGTAVASTSGTSIDFTGIPSWVKRVTVMFDGVSTSGTSPVRIQIGDSGGIENTGYAGSSDQLITGANVSTFSAGFDIADNHAAANTLCGLMTLVLMNSSSSTWASSWIFGTSNTGSLSQGAGTKSLSGTLDRVRITTVGGTDTFDAGTVNLLWEG